VADLCVNLTRESGDAPIIVAATALGDFLASPRPEVVGQSEAGRGRPLVVEHGRNAGKLARLHGISLYAPHVATNYDFDGARDLYKKFAFVQDTVWGELVHALTRRGGAGARRLALGDLTLDLDTRELRRAGNVIDLTPREADLLELLLRSPRRVVTREQALADVWLDSASPGVVDAYIMRLRAKLGDPPAIRTVRGSGFMLEA
jgi:hypothetical protein